MKEWIVKQNTPDWHALRVGCITGSNFHLTRRVGGLNKQQAAYVKARKRGASKEDAMAVAGYKTAPSAEAIQIAMDGGRPGEISDAGKNYAFRLAVERVGGTSLRDDAPSGWAAERGHELEPEARALHEELVQDMVREVGIIKTDDDEFGVSADGIRAAETIGCEYKAFLDPAKLREMLMLDDISQVENQIQGGMWLTGLQTWELGLYCPALRPVGRHMTIWRVSRDEEFIADLEADLLDFKRLVDAYCEYLRRPAEAIREFGPQAVMLPESLPFLREEKQAPIPGIAPVAAPVAEPVVTINEFDF